MWSWTSIDVSTFSIWKNTSILGGSKNIELLMVIGRDWQREGEGRLECKRKTTKIHLEEREEVD